MGVIARFFAWLERQHSIPDLTTFNRPSQINTFDIDGVIYINEEVGGVYPGRYDVIITGRSFEEIEETSEMLIDRGIRNRVFYNRAKFVNKTRETSGLHKAEVIKRLQSRGYTVMCHFEDDPIQAEVIKQHCPDVNVVMLVHDLTNKENVRHKRKSR